MKKLLLVLVLIGVSLVVAASLLPRSTSTTENGYEMAPAEVGRLAEVVTTTGPLDPKDVTPVGAAASGEVVRLSKAADFNKHVEKDAVLLEVDSRLAALKRDQARAGVLVAEAAIATAAAQLDDARAALQYQEDLQSRGVGVGQKWAKDRAASQVKIAEAGLKAAQAKKTEADEVLRQAEFALDLDKVRAPITGTIIDRKVSLGQVIAPPASGHLFTIAKDLSELQVHAQVPEGDIGKVRPGQEGTFSVSTVSGTEKFIGKVAEIHQLPVNNQGAIFYTALIDMTNKKNPLTQEWTLRPGMTATVDITCREHPDAWKMPQAALNFQPEASQQSPAAQAKLKEWEQHTDRDDWKPVWLLRGNKEMWPILVRIGGVRKINGKDETGITDNDFTEVLEWDPQEVKPAPQPGAPVPLQFITKAPPAHKPGLFERMNIKLP